MKEKGNVFMKKRVAILLVALLMLAMVFVACGKEDEHVCTFVKDDALSEDPTCDSDGVIIEKCSCGKQNTKIVEATGHDYEAGREEPTCDKAGKTYNVCKVCGEYEPGKTVDVPKLEHVFEADPENNKLPTCTEGGYDAIKCSLCGYSRRNNLVDATGHTWVTDFKWKDNIEPDCLTAATGWTFQYCSVCQIENKEFTSTTTSYAVGEYECDFQKVDTIVASCQREGADVYSCTVCQKPKVVKTEDKKSCDFSKPGTAIKEETCYNDRIELRTCAFADHTVNNTREEEMPGTRLAHTPNVANADCATDKYCSVCAAHFLGSADAVPTVDNYFAECPNKDDANCAFCTAENKVHLFAAKTGIHDGAVTDSLTIAPTCMQTGRYFHTCENAIKDGTAVCGAVFTADEDIIPIAPNAHKYADTFDKDGDADKIFPATCVSYAYKAKTCLNCDTEGTRCDEQITEITEDLRAEGYAPHTFDGAEHTGTIVCENPSCKAALYDTTYSKDVIYDTSSKGDGAVEDFGDGSSLTVTITGTKTETDDDGNPKDSHVVLNKTNTTKTLEATEGADGIVNNIVAIYVETTGEITVTVKVNGVNYTVDANGYVHLNATKLDVTSVVITAATESDSASAKIFFYSSTIINN